MGGQYKITKPIRLIGLCAGYGSPEKALEYMGVLFESHYICEYDKYAIQTYNEIHGANYTTSDMTKIGAKELNIVDTDKYEYIMTYSTPCQSLSMAGRKEGMTKGSNTKSSTIWEVERILNECEELPQILLLENVSTIHNKTNMPNFQKWIDFLTSKGYNSYYTDLTASDFNVPQSRKRTFMVSILNNGYYKFPQSSPLVSKMDEYLENINDNNYYNYLSTAMKKYIINDNEKWTGNNGKALINKSIASTLNTGEGSRRCDASNYICEELPRDYDLKQYQGNLDELKIRKLTPREMYRLMGLKDEDIDKITCSDTQKRKQAGNSICIDVLMALFGQFF